MARAFSFRRWPQLLGGDRARTRCARRLRPAGQLFLWAFAESGTPEQIPQEFGFSFWGRSLARARADRFGTSICRSADGRAGPRWRYRRAALAGSLRGAASSCSHSCSRRRAESSRYVNIARVLRDRIEWHDLASCSCTRRTDSAHHMDRPAAFLVGRRSRRPPAAWAPHRGPAGIEFARGAGPHTRARSSSSWSRSTSSPEPISSACPTSRRCRSSCSTRAWAATTRSRRSPRCCC